MQDALKLASDYWPEIASFGIFLAGLVALAAAVAWLYTAISRARDVQHLIGLRSTADAMCQRVNVNQRKTFLAELVGLEIAKEQLERM